MTRTPFQVLVFPYRVVDQDVKFAVFQRPEKDSWQGISGKGQELETPIEAARRKSGQEAGLDVGEERFMVLDCVNAVPASQFAGHYTIANGRFVLPQYCFGVEVDSESIQPNDPQADYRWIGYEEATSMLASDASKTALWELYARLQRRVKTEELMYQS
ncbi:MAG: NUDIX domain-containing protein [Rhodothermales bacterium]|nr:NUDIX domain-containing protein [Rhodothermales bacterium]